MRSSGASIARIVAALCLACAKSTPAALAIGVAVVPATAGLLEGTTQQFTATVTGTNNTAVTWSVPEGPPGGTVDANGLYTAPAAVGTFHVIATSAADTSKTASAAVSVSTLKITVSLSPRATYLKVSQSSSSPPRSPTPPTGR
jgi:hypothetical protein